jgi:hypothetical protein
MFRDRKQIAKKSYYFFNAPELSQTFSKHHAKKPNLYNLQSSMLLIRESLKLIGFVFFFKKAIAFHSFFFNDLSIFLNPRKRLSHFLLAGLYQNSDNRQCISFSMAPASSPHSP